MTTDVEPLAVATMPAERPGFSDGLVSPTVRLS
jgi:hypothetical protein